MIVLLRNVRMYFVGYRIHCVREGGGGLWIDFVNCCGGQKLLVFWPK